MKRYKLNGKPKHNTLGEDAVSIDDLDLIQPRQLLLQLFKMQLISL